MIRPSGHGSTALPVLALSALGVVYGDIGTSPLYALRECFSGHHAMAPVAGNILGVLSLVFWSLLIVITVKYLLLIMRADNHGEGGIMSLMALVTRSSARQGSRRRATVIILGLFGAALLYGDGIITPAISVLSAVEGLKIVAPDMEAHILPISVAILIGLFIIQHRGTAGIGKLFGPVILVWFITIGALGCIAIVRNPSVLVATNPMYAVRFFMDNGWHGYLVMGVVFLVVTGGEALYADMGHFGAKPIRVAWFAVVLPALLLNYFGQGALLLENPAAAENPFFLLAPRWFLLPLVVIATFATVIASQAVITGAFSLTKQALQLNYLPRMSIEHTSATEIGQIYIPQVNWALLAATILLVLTFKTSSNLAAAYGIAVTTTMVITTLLAFIAMRRVWNWSLGSSLAVTSFFFVIDFSFFGANALKIGQGGWFPLIIGLIVYMSMATWRKGREILGERLRARTLPFDLFLDSIRIEKPHRVKGTAIVMTGNPAGTPPALLHNFKVNKVIHEKVILLTVQNELVPFVTPDSRAAVENLGEGFFRITARYGFMEIPQVTEILAVAKARGCEVPEKDYVFILGRETLLVGRRPAMAVWRERLFMLMSRNAQAATTFFGIPPERVLEVGMQVEL